MTERNESEEGQGLAIASLVLGCISMLFSIFTAIPGVICGHLARRNSKNGMALAGLIISYLFIFLFVAQMALFVLLVSSDSEGMESAISHMLNDFLEIEK